MTEKNYIENLIEKIENTQEAAFPAFSTDQTEKSWGEFKELSLFKILNDRSNNRDLGRFQSIMHNSFRGQNNTDFNNKLRQLTPYVPEEVDFI